MTQLFLNNFATKLRNAVSNSSTSITVSMGDGPKLPFLNPGEYFYLTLFARENGVEVNHEIIKVTSRIDDVLTIERAQEGTLARAWVIDTPIELRSTAKTFSTLDNDTVATKQLSVTGPSTLGTVSGTAASFASTTVSGPVTAGSAALAAPLPITSGGSGANTAAGARTNLDVYSKAEADTKFVDSTGSVTLAGDVTGTATFSGDSVTINTLIAANAVALGTDTTGNYIATGAVSGVGLTGSATGEGSTFTVTSNATSANTANTIVARDATGDFSAGTITAALSGNASTASTLQTARTISLAGDVTGSVSFNGGANVSITTVVADDSHNHSITTINNFTEEVQDIVGGMVSTNVENGIAVTYDDVNGKLDFDVSDFSISLAGDVTGSATVTNLGNVTIAATIAPDSVALGTDTTGNYIATGAVSGVGLTGSATGEGSTFTVTSNATSANTANTLVSRDATGNFSAGTITAALAGNASTASTLQTARTISLAGDVTGSVSFNGGANVSIATTIAPDSVALGTDTTGDYIAAGAVSGVGLTGSATGEGSTFTVTSNATSANTANTIVARDATGNFSAGTITAALSGNATTATTLQTARTISLAGDVTGSVSFNGGANVSITTVVADDSHNHSTATITNFTEDVQDIVGGMLIGPGAGQAGISVVYDDANGKLVFNTNDFAISLTGDVTGSATVTDLGSVSISTTIAPNSVALGTDTTGDYVANGFVSGVGLSGGVSGEGSTFIVSSNATSANSSNTIVSRDASGNFAASQITNTISNVNTVFPVAQTVAFSGAVSLDVSAAQYFLGTLTAATTFSFVNPPVSGRVGEFIIEIANAGNFAITWPTGTKWSGAVTPVRTTNGVDVFAFTTVDAGVTWRGSLIIKDSR